jgi:hypothetical protein
MAIESTTRVEERTFAPGTVVKNRGRLWRVDGQEQDVALATAIDAGRCLKDLRRLASGRSGRCWRCLNH